MAVAHDPEPTRCNGRKLVLVVDLTFKDGTVEQPNFYDDPLCAIQQSSKRGSEPVTAATAAVADVRAAENYNYPILLVFWPGFFVAARVT